MVDIPKPVVPTRGAQVRLTGDAVTAARGGFPGDIEGNTVIKKSLEDEGVVANGYTVDGTTVSGEPPVETVLQPGQHDPATQPEPAPAPAPAPKAKAAPAPAPAPTAE